jgi:DNA-binding PadR family transcriptional regulator
MRGAAMPTKANARARERPKLPEITALQFLVISLLSRAEECPGRELRARLLENGVRSTGPQFYQMMSRLEDAGYVEGWYAQKEIEHQVVNERRYRITADGLAAWDATADFYDTHRRQADAPPIFRGQKRAKETMHR